MSSTKKTIYIITAGCMIFMFTFFKLFVDNHEEPCLFLGILFMLASYHLTTRLVAGTFCDAALEKGIDTENHWFADNSAEKTFYRVIGVKKWKNKLPVPEAWRFSIKRRSLEDVIAETCRTELVHEIGVVISLLSVLLSIPFGYLWFFILTAVLGGLFDLVFITVQRYNRPRLARTAAQKRLLFFEKLEYDNAFAEFEGKDNDGGKSEADGIVGAEIIAESGSADKKAVKEEDK